MVKVRWNAHVAGRPEHSGGRGTVVIPLKVKEDPTRPVELAIPASRAKAFIRQLEHALQSELTQQSWAKGGPAGRSEASEVE